MTALFLFWQSVSGMLCFWTVPDGAIHTHVTPIERDAGRPDACRTETGHGMPLNFGASRPAQ